MISGQYPLLVGWYSSLCMSVLWSPKFYLPSPCIPVTNPYNVVTPTLAKSSMMQSSSRFQTQHYF